MYLIQLLTDYICVQSKIGVSSETKFSKSFYYNHLIYIYMSDLTQRQTNCDHCGVEIRIIMIQDIIENRKGVYWCDKIKCIIILTKNINLDWRHYIEPDKWKEGYELIADMETEKFK